MKRLMLAVTVLAVLSLCVTTKGFTADIVGTVADANGASLPGVAVSAQNSAGSSVASAVSDSMGRYSLQGLAPGTYTLNASGQSAVSYVGANGLTVDWGVARNAPAIAIARAGTESFKSNRLTEIESTANDKEGLPPKCKGIDGPPCGPKSPKK